MLICTNEDCGTENRDEATYCTKCGNLLLKVVGDYRVLELIGQGANGAVYRAEHRQRPGEIRALKAVFKRTDIASLKAEFEVLKDLHHPNLPRYDAWFEHLGYGYLVMEFVPGPNLELLLAQRRGPLSPTLVLGYALQLCDVLTFLHTQPQRILHRDLKPANIRLTHTDVVKLVDFGLLKQGTDVTRKTQRGRGTLAYMPLEQYGGQGQHTDQRSDLYSLGATLYHLLTGERPPFATSADPLLPADALNPNLAPHVVAALGKALRRFQADRYDDVASFKVALLHAGTQREAAERQRKEAERIRRLLPAMVEVPAGPFLMGSTDQQLADVLRQDAKLTWVENEKPQHTLTLPRYWIGKTPVTNAQFRPFVESDGYTNQAYWTSVGWQWREAEKIVKPLSWDNAKWNGADYPVVGVSWFEALAYCRWLSQQTGIAFRLPTEAEWEKAARGPDGRLYPWGNTWEEGRCNSEEANIECTTPVGKYPTGASPYGALDMVGTVWEWCVTQWQKPYPYQLEDEWQAAYVEADEKRVVRGGSWGWDSKSVCGAYRINDDPRVRSVGSLGLRVASHSLRVDASS